MDSANKNQLVRGLSLIAAISIVVGNVIGTGVFLKARVMTCNVGTPKMVLLVYVIAGLLSLAGALSYAELAAMMPKAGGEYVFMREAYGDELRRLRVRLEDKEAIAALHWRGVPDEEDAQAAIEQVARRAEDAGYKTHWGRKVLEIRPPVRIDKGAGVSGLLRDLDLAAALYVGDDTTDLDAFRALGELVEAGRLGHALRVGVSSDEGPPRLEQEADVMVDGTDGVRDLLRALLA